LSNTIVLDMNRLSPDPVLQCAARAGLESVLRPLLGSLGLLAQQ